MLGRFQHLRWHGRNRAKLQQRVPRSRANSERPGLVIENLRRRDGEFQFAAHHGRFGVEQPQAAAGRLQSRPQPWRDGLAGSDGPSRWQ
jgi:hypothetical protein